MCVRVLSLLTACLFAPIGLAAESITVESAPEGGITLVGPADRNQLIVTARDDDGRRRDVTREVQYTVTPPEVVAVDESGLVTPRKEGTATVRATAKGASAEVRVTVTRLVDEPPVSFPDQVVPLLTKLGCNTGGCHGKSGGQNGFMLSLFGFEAAEDYEYIVNEARGRRIFPAAPAQSLLLRKPTGAMSHGGGKPLREDSEHYDLLLRWITQGMPYSAKDAPTVERIDVVPQQRTMERGAEQQLAVLARLSDGSTRDITRLSQFEPIDEKSAEVSETGLVHIKDQAGAVAVMARFQSHVATFQATVPLGMPVENLPEPSNFIDELVFTRLKELGLPPSEVCDDGTFIRRATIDIAGRLPTLEETTKFLEDKSAKKYEQLIDRLLDSEDHAYYFANKWGAILRNRRADSNADPKGTFAFHEWIKESLQKNKPYDQFVREIITATGEEVKTPPTVWYREVNEPSAQVEDVAQLFLGQRISCARCHHHPFEKWSQQDYYGMVAFFERIEVKDPPRPKKKKDEKEAPPKPPLTVSYKPGKDQSINPRTGDPVPPTGLGAAPADVSEKDDPRAKLADWMTDPKNPYFAKSLVNRYWKHFFDVGLVDPEDDIRITNPPSNPELLGALAGEFIKNKYDLKSLIKTICLSKTYRLSAVPNQYNAEDRQNFSRFVPKRLSAEVLLDAIDVVTGTKTTFKGAPENDARAVQLPDNAFESYFLSVFGRPDAASACECERSSDATLAQSLHMFNSKEILDKVTGQRAAEYGKADRPPEEQLRELYLLAISREPSDEEMAVLTSYIEKKGENTREAYEDIVWALINTKEFLFNH